MFCIYCSSLQVEVSFYEDVTRTIVFLPRDCFQGNRWKEKLLFLQNKLSQYANLGSASIICKKKDSFSLQACYQVLALGAIWLLLRWEQSVRMGWIACILIFIFWPKNLISWHNFSHLFHHKLTLDTKLTNIACG